MATQCLFETETSYTDRFEAYTLAKPKCSEQCAQDKQCIGFHWTNYRNQRQCVLVLFSNQLQVTVESKNLETSYGEHKLSIPDRETEETRFQKDLFANYTKDLAHAHSDD